MFFTLSIGEPQTMEQVLVSTSFRFSRPLCSDHYPLLNGSGTHLLLFNALGPGTSVLIVPIPIAVYLSSSIRLQ